MRQGRPGRFLGNSPYDIDDHGQETAFVLNRFGQHQIQQVAAGGVLQSGRFTVTTVAGIFK